MNKRKVFSIVSVLCFATLMLGLAMILFSPAAMAAHESTETTHITRGGNSNLFTSTLTATNTTTLTATNSIPDINNHVVALVMQPTQEQIHAFSALTGEWASLGGSGFRVNPDDIAIVSKLVILVAQPGQEQLHAFSALTGEWATLGGNGFRVNADDIFKVNDSVIIVAQPGQEQIHAYSAFTGKWATLAGSDFKVAPDDVVLVGTEN
jgi:hypothetical protein